MRTLQRRMLALALPLMLCFLLFYAAPFVLSGYYSLINSAFDPSFAGLKNYRDVIGNPYFRLAFGNTLRFSGVAVPLLMGLSLSVALLMFDSKDRGNRIMGSFVLPMLMPSVIIALLIRSLFHPYYGAAVAWITGMGVSPDALPELSLHIIFLWRNLGFNLILLRAAMLSIPHELYEAAQMDGAGGLRRHISITLPCILPAIFFTGILSAVYSLRVFKEAYLLYGAYPPDGVYYLQHYINNHFMKLNYQKLTAAALLFFLAVYALIFIVYRATLRVQKGR